MNTAIEKAQSVLLTDGDIDHFTYGRCNIFTTPELNDVSSMDELLGKHGAAAILYETSIEGHTANGHWCALTKRSSDTVEFMDPYGIRIDDEEKWMSSEFKVQTQQYSRLTQLINDPSCPYRVVYNREVLQKLSPKINTCGRYVALRIRLKQLSLLDFVKLLKSDGFTPDGWVTAMTILP